MNLKLLYITLLIICISLPTCSGQFYYAVIYNRQDSAFITVQRLKFKSTVDGEQKIGRYLHNAKPTPYYYFMVAGPYSSEDEAVKARELKTSQFLANGFLVQPIIIDQYKTPNNPGMISRPIDFSPSVLSGKGAHLKSGYIKNLGARIKVRVYAQGLNGGKGALLYENWIEKGGFVKITSETGRIGYNYKYVESDSWSGNVYVVCEGTISQAVSIF